MWHKNCCCVVYKTILCRLWYTHNATNRTATVTVWDRFHQHFLSCSVTSSFRCCAEPFFSEQNWYVSHIANVTVNWGRFWSNISNHCKFKVNIKTDYKLIVGEIVVKIKPAVVMYSSRVMLKKVFGKLLGGKKRNHLYKPRLTGFTSWERFLFIFNDTRVAIIKQIIKHWLKNDNSNNQKWRDQP